MALSVSWNGREAWVELAQKKKGFSIRFDQVQREQLKGASGWGYGLLHNGIIYGVYTTDDRKLKIVQETAKTMDDTFMYLQLSQQDAEAFEEVLEEAEPSLTR